MFFNHSNPLDLRPPFRYIYRIRGSHSSKPSKPLVFPFPQLILITVTGNSSLLPSLPFQDRVTVLERSRLQKLRKLAQELQAQREALLKNAGLTSLERWATVGVGG